MREKTIKLERIICGPPTDNWRFESAPNFGVFQPIVIRELPYEGFFQWIFGYRKYKVVDGVNRFHDAVARYAKDIVCIVLPENSNEITND